MNMISSKMYPIHKLDDCVTKVLQKIISADIKTNVQNGLHREIKFVDECSHITNVAEIKGTNDNAQVYLSSAYCQFFWLINDIALKQVDFDIIQDECKIKANICEFKESVENILKHPEVLHQVEAWHKIDVNQYYDYLKRCLQLLDNEKFSTNIKKELDLAISILDSDKSINMDDFNDININGLYEQLANAVYCYGIAFILLHELSHFELKHLDPNKKEEMQDEINADYNAFWSIYNDLSGRELYSANIGILCALFSLLMWNPKMEEDGVHPKESDRIFSILDLIGNENPKYMVLVDKLFKLWAKYNKIQGFPYVDHNLNESLSQIRSFMNTYKR